MVQLIDDSVAKVKEAAERVYNLKKELAGIREDMKETVDGLMEDLELGKDKQAKKIIKKALSQYVKYLQDPTGAIQEWQATEQIFGQLLKAEEK